MPAMALLLVPGGLAMLAIAPLSARLSARSGPKTTLVTGALVIAAGFTSSLLLMSSATLVDGYSTPSLSSLHGVLLLGCGVSLGAAALTGALPSRARALGAGLSTRVGSA